MRYKLFFAFLSVLLFICGCGNNDNEVGRELHTLTDVYGNTATIRENARVISAYGSFSECWLLSGGKLVGVTEDAVSERGLELSDDIAIIGTVKELNLEMIVSLAPDYVILSADIAAHAPIGKSLESMNIPYGYYRIDTFEDYSDMMRQFCTFNNREDLYKLNVTDVEKNISSVISAASSYENVSYLLMRVYSTGIKVKNDNIADDILKNLGAVSIADRVPSLLKDLSAEEVIAAEPDYIFILTMGDEQAGKDYFEKNIVSNPAWHGLSAVKNGNYHILPKKLFHYKPNNRWAESYLYIANILSDKIELND